MRTENGVVAMLLGLAACAGDVAGGESQSALAGANNAFALDFYRRIQGQTPNLFFSPYSLSAAFGMTYAGAGGNTAEQMNRVFHWNRPPGQVAGEFQSLDKALRDAGGQGVQLAVANSLWPLKDYKFLPEFTRLLQHEFGGAFFPADYARNAPAERLRINRWISEQTQGKIKDLIPEGALNALTRLVLCNAIYFKGDWDRPFRTNATAEAPFYLEGGGQATCRLMTQESEFGYRAVPGWNVLSMPYKGRELSMVVLLPDQPGGLSSFGQEVNPDKLSSWIRGLPTRKVKVFLPRFTARFNTELSAALKGLGMTDAFSPEADFSNMNGRKRDLYISKAFHQAFVDVNEQGTEAAAATAVVVATRASPVEPVPVFRADRPFLYFIMHNPSGTILFMGRMANPGA